MEMFCFQITIETIEKAASQVLEVHHQEVAEIEVTEAVVDPGAIGATDVQVDTNAEEGGIGVEGVEGAILIITTKTELTATVICLRARQPHQHPLPRLLTCLLRPP